MTITPTTLTRAAGLSAVVAGLLFFVVQVKHPQLDTTFITTTEWTIRQTMKVSVTVLALVGITGMYLRQVRQTGILGLLGYLLAGAGYLLMMSAEVIGVAVLPAIAHSTPGYVTDVLAVLTGGTAAGDIGLMQQLSMLTGAGYVLGGLLFGIAVFRAGILARWAAVLLAVSTVATLAIPLLPEVNQRLFALPNAVALIGLGYSLWREQRTAAPRPTANPITSTLDPVGAR